MRRAVELAVHNLHYYAICRAALSLGAHDTRDYERYFTMSQLTGNYRYRKNKTIFGNRRLILQVEEHLRGRDEYSGESWSVVIWRDANEDDFKKETPHWVDCGLTATTSYRR